MKYLLSIFLALFFAVEAEAATYYVSTTGLNSHACSTTDSPGTNKQTIAAGIACMVAAGGAGHTVLIHGGTYNEVLNEPAGTVTWPHGSSWSAGGYNTIEAVAGETVQIIPTASGNSIIEQNPTSTPFYLWFKGNNRNFIVDATNLVNRSALWANGPFIRFQSMEIKNAHGYGSPGDVYGCVSGLLTGASDIDIWDNDIHNNGCDEFFGGYSIYAGHDRISILDNLLHDNTGGGIQIYFRSGTPTGSVFARNRVYNNAHLIAGSCKTYPPFSGLGAVFVYGTGHKIYDNVIYNNCADGLSTSNSASTDQANTFIYGNTIVNNGSWGLELNGSATARNNIISGSGGVNIKTSQGTYTADHNLCSNDCNGLGSNNQINEAASATFNTLPPSGTVTGTATTSFALKAGSAAINGGTGDLGAPYQTDFAGNARSVPWDIGAYEFVASIVCPAVSPALVARYDFEGNGSDSTGNGRTATLGSGWTYTTGHTGQGALSNGTSGITVADHDSLDPCAAFTYEGWISLANTSGNFAFIVKNPDSKAFLFASLYGYCASGVPMAGYSEIITPTACSTTALTPGFKHLAVTYDSTLPSANVKLYLNGAQVASADGTNLLSATTGTLQFCTSGFGETCPSGTVIDDIRIYNYARSASEILSSITAPPVYTIKLQVSSLKIGPSVSLKVGVP